MAFEAFYQTMAQLCFTLLGLWWLVLQTKYSEWIGVRERQHTITNISLYFLLPGAMSLLALLSTEIRFLWQIAFIVASALGALETAGVIREMRRQPRHSPTTGLRWAGLALFVLVALVAVVALVPGGPAQLGIQPLGVTGVLLTLLVILGVVLAWAYFIQPPEKDTVPRA